MVFLLYLRSGKLHCVGKDNHLKRIAPLIKAITYLLDLFYPLFRKYLNKEMYYYLACGTINTCSDWVLYFLIYNFVVQKQFFDLGVIVVSPHIASLIIVTPITFLVGFCFSKYITFKHSKLETIRQALRYAATLGCNWWITYASMKLLVEGIGIYPTPSKMITTVVTTCVGYLLQKYYSFKSSK